MLFGAQGGVIYNIESGHETPFGIEDNVYVLLSAWLEERRVGLSSGKKWIKLEKYLQYASITAS